MLAFLLVLLAYLLGSIPFGVIVARAHDIDLRAVGSGNIGATNVARALGKRWAVLVMALDALKATAPVLLCGALRPDDDAGRWLQVTVAAAAFFGHLYPVFLGFRGGKGVATAFGAFLGLSPLAALLGLCSYAVAYGASRISSVGSLTALLLFPLWLLLLRAPRQHWCFAALVLVMTLLKHRDNIDRLRRRSEDRV